MPHRLARRRAGVETGECQPPEMDARSRYPVRMTRSEECWNCAELRDGLGREMDVDAARGLSWSRAPGEKARFDGPRNNAGQTS